jgi:DNA-binding response OmpR family regulator
MTDKRTVRILVVDDDPILLELLTDTLTAIGYEATPASDGIIALDILTTQKFDLMITDIKMPRMDGIQLLKKVKRHYPGLPVLFITGVASQEVIGQAEADGFLAKPFRIAHIEELIQQTLSPKDKRSVSRKPELLLIDLAGRIDETLTDGLFFHGFALFTFRDLEASVRELTNNRFAAIVADFSPWVANPKDIIERLRQLAPDTPLIINSDAFSAEHHEDVVAEFRLTGLAPIPFAASELIDLLNRQVRISSDPA